MRLASQGENPGLTTVEDQAHLIKQVTTATASSVEIQNPIIEHSLLNNFLHSPESPVKNSVSRDDTLPSEDQDSVSPLPENPFPIVNTRTSSKLGRQVSRRASFTSFFLGNVPVKPGSSPKGPSFTEKALLQIAAFMLTFSAGFTNSVALYGMYGYTVSHVTGSVTKIGIAFHGSDWEKIETLAGLYLCFLVGSCICGMIIGANDFSIGKSFYGIALHCHGTLLLVATLSGGTEFSKYFVSTACGLQNGLATTYSGAVIRTTHVTGITTDVGLMIGRLIGKIYRKETPYMAERDVWKFKLLCNLFTGFFFGGFLGPYTYDAFEDYCMFFPCAMSFGLGGAYQLYRKNLVQTIIPKIASAKESLQSLVRNSNSYKIDSELEPLTPHLEGVLDSFSADTTSDTEPDPGCKASAAEAQASTYIN